MLGCLGLIILGIHGCCAAAILEAHTIQNAAPDIFNRLNDFEPQLTNPCFRSRVDAHRLRCLPYFNIIGARLLCCIVYISW